MPYLKAGLAVGVGAVGGIMLYSLLEGSDLDRRLDENLGDSKLYLIAFIGGYIGASTLYFKTFNARQWESVLKSHVFQSRLECALGGLNSGY